MNKPYQHNNYKQENNMKNDEMFIFIYSKYILFNQLQLYDFHYYLCQFLFQHF